MRKEKEILDKSEKDIIADFFTSHYYKVVTKLLENEKRNIEKFALASQSMEDLSSLKGQRLQISKFQNTIKTIYKKSKERKKK